MNNSPAPNRRLVRGSMRGLAIIAMATMMAGLAAGTVQAHAQLTSTTPADGATLAAPPAAVTFTFDADLLPGTNTISINDDHGNVVASQQVQPDGPSVSVAWPAALEVGTYQVAYRVVSADGHPVTGAITFTIAGTGSPSPGPTSSTAEPSTASAAVSTAVAPAGEPSSSDSPAVVLLALAVAAVMGVLVAAWAVRRRRP